ncbi:hypothetical protein M9458_055679, partial [Cirrhinus mrigala]
DCVTIGFEEERETGSSIGSSEHIKEDRETGLQENVSKLSHLRAPGLSLPLIQ